ncbi:MAG: Stk1 family PASTA domain-containing Ser/Thr kinase, partial [Clostridium sp.]
MIGLILGNRYELIEKIGEGGMSEVYKAKCNKLNRFVAVKILKKELCDNADIVEKFKREATAIATLSDNNIVNVLDVGTQDELNYIVMEYVKGKTLKEVIVQFGKLNYETCITIGIQIAKALDCAHRNNIIHRDVKPQNILVTEEGVIKVTDFGIAKSASSATLTNTTTIMGSAHYFSPEQAKGSFIDNRTDIYSLGIVLYEMATGKLPFDGESPVTIALKHIQEEPVPPKQINLRVPESLNALILKAMSKDPNKRYQNAKEVITDLQKIKENPDVILGSVAGMVDNTGDHTIIMDAVKSNTSKVEPTTVKKNNYSNDYYDDEDEDDDDDEYYDDRKPSKAKKSNKGLIGGIIAVVALLAVGVGAFIFFSGSGEKVPEIKKIQVPKLVGLDKEIAYKTVIDAGLKYREVMENSNDVEEGKVIKITPDEAEVDEGAEITVYISAGKTSKKFIDYTRQSIDRAKEQITKDFGIKPENIVVREEYSDNVNVGIIISQDPVAGSPVTEDSTITLVISKGKETKFEIVPTLKG